MLGDIFTVIAAVIAAVFSVALAEAAAAQEKCLVGGKVQAGHAEGAMLQFSNGQGIAHTLIEEGTRLQGIGASVDLTEEGYATVAAICCIAEMEVFARRVVQHLGREVCNEGGFSGVIGFHTCEKGVQTLAKLIEHIHNSEEGKCAWVGLPGNCPEFDWESCGHEPNNFHRRRVCGGSYTTTAAPTATTEAPVTTTMAPTTTVAPSTTRAPTTTTAAPTTSAVPSTTTACSSSISLDIMKSCQEGRVHRNIGGFGPDSGAEEVRYGEVGRIDEKPFDVVVTALTTMTIVKGESLRSGCAGNFGILTLRSGTSATFQIAFQDSETHAPVTIPSFLFSVLDLDGVTEEVEVTGYSSFHLREPESNVLTLAPGVFQACDPRPPAFTCPYQPSDLPSDALWPNPSNPQTLTEIQKAGAVTFEFSAPTSSFTVRWGKKGQNMRDFSMNMFFAGSTNLFVPCA